MQRTRYFDRQEYPRFYVRFFGSLDGSAWPDGTMYIQCDEPGHIAGKRLDGSVVWEHSGLPDEVSDGAADGVGRIQVCKMDLVQLKMLVKESNNG